MKILKMRPFFLLFFCLACVTFTYSQDDDKENTTEDELVNDPNESFNIVRVRKHYKPLDLHNKLFVILDYNQTDKVNQFAGKNLRSIPRLGLCQFTLNKHQIVIQASRPIIKVMIVFNSWLLIFKKKSYEQI